MVAWPADEAEGLSVCRHYHVCHAAVGRFVDICI